MTNVSAVQERALITPPPADWFELLQRASATSTAQHSTFRSQMGIPTGAPIILSGHQAQIWHCGILAKYFAILAASVQLKARACWLTVDQDANNPWALQAPTADGRRIPLQIAAPPQPDVATGSLPAIMPQMPDLSGLLPSAAHGIRLITSALAQHATVSSAGEQLEESLRDLLAPYCDPALSLSATSISRTTQFAEVLEEMGADANACVSAYNLAARENPGAGVRPLQVDGRIELPLWRLSPGQPRQRVFADELGRTRPQELAPRALLMTALLRRYGCDLFVHGTGGGHYEQVTDRWIGAWRPHWALAPNAVVTATRYLGFPNLADTPSPMQIARAHWLSHRARHDPSTVEDSQAAAAKHRFLQELAAARSSGADPLPLYRAMHSMLDQYRHRSAPAIERLDEQSARLSRLRDASDVVFDRTWPFPLHDPATILGLKSEVEGMFQSGGR